MNASHTDACARREALAAASPITEALIHDQVHAFYGRIRNDPALGPIFDRVIAPDDWPAHLQKMCDFWSSVLLTSGRFKGSPVQAHLRIGELRPTHFARWLHVFEKTAQETCPAEAAEIFITRSRMIGQSLQSALQTARGEVGAPR